MAGETNDGKGVLKFETEAGAIPGNMMIKYIRWNGGTTAGDTVVVNDTAGDLIWESVADGAYFLDLHPLFQWRNGIVITTLDSGYVLVYLG